MAPAVWLITGCSTGLGLSFANELLQRGDKVIATARGDVDRRLASLKESGAVTFSLDVTAPQAELNEIVKQAWEVYGRIDVLVNNAGYCQFGTLEEIEYVAFSPVLYI